MSQEVLHSHNQAVETHARVLVINGWNALMAYLVLVAKATKRTQLVPIMEVMSSPQTTCPPGIRQTQLIPQRNHDAAGRWEPAAAINSDTFEPTAEGTKGKYTVFSLLLSE